MATEETPAETRGVAGHRHQSTHDLARVIIRNKANLIRDAAKAACFHPEHVDESNYHYAIRQLQQTLVDMCERYAVEYERLENEIEDWRERHGSRP
jgi:hypothetical protein